VTRLGTLTFLRSRRALLVVALLVVAYLLALQAAIPSRGPWTVDLSRFGHSTIMMSPSLTGRVHAGTAAASGSFSADAQAIGSAGSGGITFFPNVQMPCSTDVAGPLACLGLLEPEVTSGPDGTIYVSAQEGVPGGVNLWRRDPGSYEYVHVAKPDRNDPITSLTGLALGGGDNDLAVTTDGRVLVATLSLVSAPVSYSTDRGETFTKVELANGMPDVDRMWLTTVGKSTVYYAYHDNTLSQIWLVKSTDGGETWSPPVPVIPPDMLPQSVGIPFVTVGNVQGDIVADPDGRVYMPFLSSKGVDGNTTPLNKPDAYYVAVTDTNGENPTVHTVYEGDEDIQGLFPAIASDLAGNIYATWSNKHRVLLAISRDHGVTWSKPQAISTGAGNTSTVFPFVIAGSRGRVALAWLGSDAETNDVTEAKWKAYFAQSLNALDADPTWTQVVASDDFVHIGSICLEGLFCDVTGGDRSLAEVLQMGLTKDGRVIISYPTTRTGASWAYVAEQRFGPGMFANITPTPPPLQPDKPGGIVRTLLKKLPPIIRFFTGEGAGSTGLQDEQGNQVDAPGDTGGLSPAPGSEGHVASANEFTTSFAVPLAFDGPTLTANQILGGNLVLTAFLSEPTAGASGDVTAGTINVRLVDVAPDGMGVEIFYGETDYTAGVDASKGVYTYKIPGPYEVLKGHHLRAEISTLHSQYSAPARFYYGDATYPAGFAVDTFTRTSVLSSTPAPPKPKPRVKPGLPATGVASSWLLGLTLLAAAAAVTRTLRRRPG
jgi:hypothetical protein